MGLNISYSVQVALSELSISNVSESTIAFNDLKRKLSAGIVAGNLTKYLRVNAKNLNASALSVVYASPIQYFVPSTFTIVGSNTAPTLFPSTISRSASPSGRFENNTALQGYIALWNQKNRAILQSSMVSQDPKSRILYNAVSVNNTVVLGGCSSWNSFCMGVRSLLTAPLSSQLALNTINFVTVLSLNNVGQSWRCTDADAAALIASSLCSTSTLLLRTNISCGGHRWITATCVVNGILQPTMCVDCANPCFLASANSQFIDPCTAGNSTTAVYHASSITILEVDFSSINSSGSQYWALSYAVATVLILLASFITSSSFMSTRSKVGPAESVGDNISAPVRGSVRLLLMKPSRNTRWLQSAAMETPRSVRNASIKRDFDADLTFVERFAAGLVENIIDQDLMNMLDAQNPHRSSLWARFESLFSIFVRNHAYIDWLRSDTATSPWTAGLFVLTRVTCVFLCSALIILVDLPSNQQGSCDTSLSQSQCSSQVTSLSRRSFCAWLPGSGTSTGDGAGQASCVVIDSGFSANYTAFAIAISILGMRALRSTWPHLLLWLSGFFCTTGAQNQFVIKRTRKSPQVADETSEVAHMSTNTVITPLGEAESDAGQLLDDFVGGFRRYTQYLTENNGHDELNDVKRGWKVCNPTLLQYMLDEHPDDEAYQNELLQSYTWNDPLSVADSGYQSTIEAVASELLRVDRYVRDLLPVFSAMSSRVDIFSANLWFQFMVDSIGADSAAACVFKQLVSRLCTAEECRLSYNSRLKFLALVCGVLGFECGVFLLTAATVGQQIQRIQLLFITISAIIALLDVCVVAILETLVSRVILPMCIYGPIEALRSSLGRLVGEVKSTRSAEDSTNKLQFFHPYFSRQVETSSKFAVQQYLHRSVKIASKFPHLAVSRVVLAGQEAYPVTAGTPYWPSSTPYVGKGLCGGATHSESVGFDHQSVIIVAVSRAASFLPSDAQDMAISLVPAGLSVCAVYVGRAMGIDSAEGLLLAIGIVSIAFVFLLTLLVVSCGLMCWGSRQQRHGSRISTALVESSDVLIGVNDIDRDLSAKTEEGKGRTPEPEHKTNGESREDAEEVASRVDSSVPSFSLSLSSKSADSIDKYISAPVNISLYDFESDTLDGGDVLDIESIETGSYATLEEYNFLPGPKSSDTDTDDSDRRRTTNEKKKKNQQRRSPTSTHEHELSNMNNLL